MKITQETIREWIHDLSNLIMPLSGILTLSKIQNTPLGQEDVIKLEGQAERLSKKLIEMRSSFESEVSDETLYEITYLSHAKTLAGNAHSVFEEITKESTIYNAKSNVSGYLLLANNVYIQRIEGSKDAIDTLFAKIMQDARHNHFSVVSSGKIKARCFSKWSSSHALVVDEKSELSVLVKELVEMVKDNDPISSVKSLTILNYLAELMRA